MLLGVEASDKAEKVLGSQGVDLAVSQGCLPDEVRTIEYVVLESREASPLVELGVCPVFLDVGLESLEDVLVATGIEHQILDDVDCLADVLVKTIGTYECLSVAGAEHRAAGQGVHLLLDLLGASGRSTEIVEVLESEGDPRIVVHADVEAIAQTGDVIELVLLVEHSDPVSNSTDGHLPGEIDKYRFDRSDLDAADFLEEGTAPVAVGLDRSDGRSGNLADGLVRADALVGNDIAVGAQIVIGPVDDLLLGNPGYSFHVQGIIFPVMAIDE